MGEIVKPDGSKATQATAEDRLRPLFDWLKSSPHPSAFQRVIVNALLALLQMVGNLTRQYVEHRHNEDGTVVLPANVLEQAARVVQADNEAEEAAEPLATGEVPQASSPVGC